MTTKISQKGDKTLQYIKDKSKDITNHGMPSDLEAERAIFSVIFIEPEKFIEVADLLDASDFYVSSSQEIWRAMHALFKKGTTIDIVSMRGELKELEIDPTPAMNEISMIYELVVSHSNLKDFVARVKNKSLLRQIILHSEKNKVDSYLNEAVADKILASMEKDIINISDRIKDNRPTDAGGILNEVRVDFSKVEAGGWKGINTGFEELDEKTGGFIPTQVWIVGAYTGTGKTFFILQMIINLLKQDTKVCMFSTEMDRKMCMLRLLGNLAGLGTIQMLKGNLKEDEYTRRIDAEKQLGNYKNNLHIFDNVYTIEEIRLKVKKLKVQQGLDVVFVDFIQNLRGESNIYERMSNAAIELQSLAQELGVTMIIVSQVSQSAASWSKGEAISYKGAGEIAAVADVGIWLTKNKDGGDDERLVYLRKVRHGSPAKFSVRLSFPSGRVLGMGVTETVDQEQVPEQPSILTQLDD